tara:strand:+ start:606 stop:845 length:240 start_codon:yes stop_codon:yes gene_type:complete
MLIIHNVRSKKRNEMEEKIKNILSNSYTKKGEFDEDKALNQLCVLLGVSKNEAICNCENKYWKEDEGGDWYCAIHDKQA